MHAHYYYHYYNNYYYYLGVVDAGNGFLACMRTMAELPLDCPRVNIAWIEENRRTRAALCSIQILSKYY